MSYVEKVPSESVADADAWVLAVFKKELCAFLDGLHEKGVKFGITNLITHKGKTNVTFSKWAKKYRIYDIDSNYISFNDNTIKEDTKEVFVTNYGKGKV